MGNSKLSAIRRITIENIDKVNFSENIYIAQAKSLFYILTEVCPERFLFICFTEHDFGLGRNYKSCVTSLEPYESCEDAIIDAITKSYVYEFSNRKDYISWLIHAIKEQLEHYSGNFAEYIILAPRKFTELLFYFSEK